MLTSCREYRERLIELARGSATPEQRRDVMAHIESCAACAQALDGQFALSAAMEQISGAPLPEMAEIETCVMAEFDTAARKRNVVPIRRWAIAVALAAAILIGVILMSWRHALPVPAPGKKQDTTAAAVPAGQAPVREPGQAVAVRARPRSRLQRASHMVSRLEPEEQPFLMIPYTVPLGPEERTTVVRMEMPVSALIAAGYNVPVSDAGAVVEADVLVSADGRARAIRPLSISASR